MVSMSCADAKLAFEHYIDWSSSPGELSLKIDALHRSITLTYTELERVMKFALDALSVPFHDRRDRG